MGADLITAVLYHPATLEPDWEAGREALKSIKVEDVEDWSDTFYNAPDPEEEPEEYLKEVREQYELFINEVQDSLGARDVNEYEFLGHRFYITGDMSWGDCPETVDAFCNLGLIPKVMKAMGFVIE